MATRVAMVVRPHTHSLLGCKRQRKRTHVNSSTHVTSEASNSILQANLKRKQAGAACLHVPPRLGLAVGHAVVRGRGRIRAGAHVRIVAQARLQAPRTDQTPGQAGACLPEPSVLLVL